MQYRFPPRIVCFSILLLTLTTPVFGQAGRSEINGTIFDQAKAVLPGVTITVTDDNTGLTRATVTSSEGRYQAGMFLEMYNLTNRVNFGDPTGNRNSRNFMVPIVAGEPRTVQLGVRFTF